MYARASRPTAHLPSSETSSSRIVESESETYLPVATTKASRNVLFRSAFARIICTDWIRSSCVRQTSTSAVESVLERRPVSAAGDWPMMPNITRWLSSLQESVARSLTTHPCGKPGATVRSSFAVATSGLVNAARTSVTTSSWLSRSRIRGTSLPFSTAIAVPASFQARRL